MGGCHPLKLGQNHQSLLAIFFFTRGDHKNHKDILKICHKSNKNYTGLSSTFQIPLHILHFLLISPH